MYHNMRNASQVKTLLSTGLKSNKTTVALNGYAQTRNSSGGNFPSDQFSIKNTAGWQSWRDIPDSAIPTTSKRDPDNLIYSTRMYINLRKKQLWFLIADGQPVWLKFGLRDKIHFYFICVALAANTVYVWYNFYLLWSGKGGKK